LVTAGQNWGWNGQTKNGLGWLAFKDCAKLILQATKKSALGNGGGGVFGQYTRFPWGRLRATPGQRVGEKVGVELLVPNNVSIGPAKEESGGWEKRGGLVFSN